MIKEVTGFSTLGDVFYYAKDVDVAASAIQSKFHSVDLNEYPRRLSKDNLIVAVRCFDAIEKRATETQSAHARVVTGLRYEFGLANDVDHGAALRFYVLAAAQNNPIAQYALSRFYRDGIHLHRNAAKQRHWLIEAAAKGFVPAKNELEQTHVIRPVHTQINWGAFRPEL